MAYLVAVGTSDGENIDQKFGEVKVFSIYKVDENQYSLLEMRKVQENADSIIEASCEKKLVILGDLYPTDCAHGEDVCDHRDTCFCYPLWGKLNKAMDEVLENTSLQDLINWKKEEDGGMLYEQTNIFG